MKYSLLLIAVLLTLGAGATTPDAPSVEGRWDITIHMSNKDVPSWLEVMHSGRKTLIGRFVYAFGSARPVAEVKPVNGKYNFSIPPQWEPGDRNMDFEFAYEGDSLRGTMVYTDGKTYQWSGVRAPALRRTAEPVWGKPITLFNGKDLSGWHAMGRNQWVAENGILKSPRSGSNLVTDQTFNDFKLHMEFRYPKESNSGVYLRGRYEVQIEDNRGMDPLVDRFSAIYGFISPNEMTAKEPGEWQTYDIIIVGRIVTVVANGKTVICSQEIPGITGGAIDSKENEPGPILIQGDHGPVEFRNIVLTPAR